MKVFGIGCIYFGYPGVSETGHSEKIDREKYIDDLVGRLEAVENVSNVNFHGDQAIPYGGTLSIDEGYREILTPTIQGGARMEFDIYLPFRVQEGIHGRCDVELVHIDIVWGYELPVTIISYDWPDEEGDADPSTAVVIFRKYLQNKITDDSFICGCIGPSPFHADFALIESALDNGVVVNDISGDLLGYAQIEVICPSGTSLTDAFYRSKLDSILSKYYLLCEMRSRAISAHTSIVSNSRDLLSENDNAGFFKRLLSNVMRSRQIDEVNSDVFMEMLLRLEISNAIADAERYQLIGEDAPMDRFFSEFRKMATEDSWSKFADVAKFFEDRRQHFIRNASGLIAGVVGGVVGALIGSVATFALTAPAPQFQVSSPKLEKNIPAPPSAAAERLTPPPPSPEPSPAPATARDSAR